jgi:hypothetical protein
MIYERREVDGVVVVVAPDTPIRQIVGWVFDFVDNWVGGMNGGGGRSQIIVYGPDSDSAVWKHHGYPPEADPVGALEVICEEISHFGLDGFLRRHRRGYFSKRQPPNPN